MSTLITDLTDKIAALEAELEAELAKRRAELRTALRKAEWFLKKKFCVATANCARGCPATFYVHVHW